MKLIDKFFLLLFTKSTDRIISGDGSFELQIPSGFRHKLSRKMYQVFNPLDRSFLFQISGFVLADNKSNEFDINHELANSLKTAPNSVIQTTGNYDCICTATITEDKRLRTYVWKIGYRNKRILVTVLLHDIQQDEAGEKIKIVQNLLNGLTINT